MGTRNSRLSAAAICIAWAALCAHSGDARAQGDSVNTVFQNYKLVGIFARDCTKPPASNNYYVIHRYVNAGHVQRDRMSGPIGRDYVNVYDKAVAIDQSQILIGGTRAEGDRKGEPVEEVWRVEPNRIMNVQVTIGGAKLVSNGIFNGQPVSWLNRCPAVDAPSSQVSATLPPTPTPPAPPPPTSAGCRTDNYTFSTVLNQSATANSVSTGGAACSYSVAPIHPDQVQFTDASIVGQPQNGSFQQTGGFAFRYQPNSGFRGADEYAIKVCGHNSQRAGCATITYRVNVR